tara:strand:- start:553 stop:678 length:126 start_codon:yes stop_codon:yes gene_type:complete
MDYIIGFLFGYFFKQVWEYLKGISEVRPDEKIFWIEQDDLP